MSEGKEFSTPKTIFIGIIIMGCKIGNKEFKGKQKIENHTVSSSSWA